MELDFLNDSESNFELGAEDSQLSEVYLAGGDIGEDDNGLIWKEILREGEWAYRPGPGQKPIPVPLKVVKGNASNNMEIGMADLLDAFNDQAVDHVTVPTSHEDKVDENTGYVRALKMKEENGKYKLIAGIDFTEPDIKDKTLRRTIADTSAGIIFDYVKKDSGKTYSQVLGHVALTNKPWINGMKPFGMSENINVAFSDENIAPLVLTDGPDEEYLVALSADEIDSLDNLYLKDFTAERRRQLAKKGHALPDGSFPIENEDDLKNAIQAFGRAKNKEAAKRHIIKRAKALGKTNLLPDSWKVNLSDDNANKPTEVSMAKTKEEGTEETRQEETSNDPAPDAVLSEEAREALKTELSEEFKSQLSERVAENEKLRKQVHEMNVEQRINELKEEGFSEYPGLLKTIRDIMLADNGKETLTLSETDDKGETKEISLSVSGAIEQLVAALPKQDGKINFGEQTNSTEDKNRPSKDVKEDKSDEERIALAAEELGLPGFEKPDNKKDGDA